MIIATLPAVYREELIAEIISHPLIGGVRYNVGVPSSETPKATLEKVLTLIGDQPKKLWVDLKGRQLRIMQWSAPLFGKIILNHEVEVEGPARVYFRGDDWSALTLARGNTIYVEPPPTEAVGQGQAINIIGENVAIKGYLTDEDKQYLLAAKEMGINRLMLSFVEEESDIAEVESLWADAGNPPELVLKLESQKGLDFFASNSALLSHYGDPGLLSHHGWSLMVARDDLSINLGESPARMLRVLEEVRSFDSQAMVGSQLFAGLERRGSATVADFSDLHWLYQMGYKNFLLSDGVCQRCFKKAMAAWQSFFNVYPEYWEESGGDNE